jgi:hypothetical protein
MKHVRNHQPPQKGKILFNGVMPGTPSSGPGGGRMMFGSKMQTLGGSLIDMAYLKQIGETTKFHGESQFSIVPAKSCHLRVNPPRQIQMLPQ